MDCSSLLTLDAALCAPLAVSSVTCATISIIVTASPIYAAPFILLISARGLWIPPGLRQGYTVHTTPFPQAGGPYNQLSRQSAGTVHILSASGRYAPVLLSVFCCFLHIIAVAADFIDFINDTVFLPG